MTKYTNKKYDFTVEAFRIVPGEPFTGFEGAPEFGKLFADIPETHLLLKYKNTNMVISDELFQRSFVREPALA